jgi:hypothetical protein
MLDNIIMLYDNIIMIVDTNQTKEGLTMTTTTKKEEDRAKDQAKAQFSSIKEMVKALQKAEKKGNDEAIEEARRTIEEDPLSVEVRSGWHTPGAKAEDEEFNILLCTGGPAVRIIGELGQYNEPEKATIQYQDWFTQWTDYPLDSKDEEILLTYCRTFYFGE